MPNRPQANEHATPAKPPQEQPHHLKTHEKSDKKKWDLIDEHAWESFPASDPPASWAGKDIPPDQRQQAASSDEKPTKTHDKNKKSKGQQQGS